MISVDPTVRGAELGHALRELREREQLSLAEVAARIDLSVTTLSRSESSTPTWHKSSYSGSQENCVEIAHPGPAVLVRDSKNPTGEPIALPATTFHGLLSDLGSIG